MDQDKCLYTDHKKYTSPTGARYTKPCAELYSNEEEGNTSIIGEPHSTQPKALSTPFPKSNPRDVKIFILKAEAWFRFNQVYNHESMNNHTSSQLNGNTCEWWTSKLCVNQVRQGKLFHDWQFFTQRLTEQFNPRNIRVEAYNKLLNLCLKSDVSQGCPRVCPEDPGHA
ncbi:uncharacterized protein UHOD_12017 [Ustilago sp. UG-2017b]|nr:uncharacterized protein UHOD_12017 [Ustilago sp. UG-2017b]